MSDYLKEFLTAAELGDLAVAEAEYAEIHKQLDVVASIIENLNETAKQRAKDAGKYREPVDLAWHSLVKIVKVSDVQQSPASPERE